MVSLEYKLTISVHLAQGVDDTVHFLVWYRPVKFSTSQAMTCERDIFSLSVYDLVAHSTDAVIRRIGFYENRGGVVDEI